jgi:hypothetical protein
MTDEIPNNLKSPMQPERVFDLSNSRNAAQAWMTINNSLQNNAAFLGPGTPLEPFAEEPEPRWEQYNPGVNQNILPRAGWGLMSPMQLRNISVACKEVRANIELIKRTIRGFDWDIAPVKDGDETFDTTELDAFFKKPDGIHDLKGWLELILEDLLVLDANVLWPRMNGDKVSAIDVISGDTIRINIDLRGRPAMPPAPAYFQVLWGQPRFWATSDRIIYSMMHPRTTAPYGKSPIEDMIAAINIAIRRDLQRIGAFTEGNVPHSFVGLPSSWTIEQLKEYQGYIDALIEGDEARSSKFIFIPHEGSNIPITTFSKSDIDNTGLDEFLMKVACWFFGNSPAEFGITGGRGLGGSGFMEGMEDVQYRSSIDPVVHYLQDLVTHIIQVWLKRPDAKFVVQGVEPKSDQMLQAQIDQLKINTGIYTAAYVQDRDGIDQMYRKKEKPEVGTDEMPSGDSQVNQAMRRAAFKAVRSDLKSWQETAERFMAKGWQMKPNMSAAIPPALRDEIEKFLQSAKNQEDIEVIFSKAFDLLKSENDALFSAKTISLAEGKTFPKASALTIEKNSGGEGGNVLDMRFVRLQEVRTHSAKRVASHIYPVMQWYKKKAVDKLFSTRKAATPSSRDEDKWRDEFLRALIIALILSVADIEEVENDAWAEYGFERIVFSPNEIIQQYQERVGRPLSDIAEMKIEKVGEITEKVNSGEITPESAVSQIENIFGENSANTIGDFEVGNIIGQMTYEVMTRHKMKDWRWRHLGSDEPCSSLLIVNGREYNGCEELEGKVFPISVVMPPEAAHLHCHCIGEPVLSAIKTTSGRQ